MARKHCDALSGYSKIILDTIISTEKSGTIAEEFKQKFGFKRATTDVDSVIQDESIDIVVICTPDSSHADLVTKFLRVSKHVLCEKPLARTKNDFDVIKDELEKSRKILQVGMNCRFREQYSKPKEIIDNGELGKLGFLKSTYIVNIVDSVKKKEKPWWSDHPPDIFPFLHGGGVHCIDLLRWNGGNVKKVFAKSTSFELKKELKSDTFLISLEFESGVLADCCISASAFRPNSFEFDYWLTDGSIINNTKVFGKKNNQANLLDEIKIEQKILDLRLQFQNMLESIEGNKSPLNSFEEAYENFMVISAIEKSLREGTVISISES